jgi:hypothetical protein
MPSVFALTPIEMDLPERVYGLNFTETEEIFTNHHVKLPPVEIVAGVFSSADKARAVSEMLGLAFEVDEMTWVEFIGLHGDHSNSAAALWDYESPENTGQILYIIL